MVSRPHIRLRPPKLRYVGYIGDGVDSFQCLACHEHVAMNANAERLMEWCPYCGVRWELGHVSDNRRLERQLAWSAKMPKFEQQFPLWVIEERNVYYKNWEASSHNVLPRSAVDIYREVKHQRAQSVAMIPSYGYEYRVRLARVVAEEEEAQMSAVLRTVMEGMVG